MYKFTHYCSLISISIKSGLGGGRIERDRNLYRSDGKEHDRGSLNKLIYKKAAICILLPRNWRADTHVMRLRRVSGEGGGSGRTSGSRGSRSGGGEVGQKRVLSRVCSRWLVEDLEGSIVEFLGLDVEVFFRIKGSQWLVRSSRTEGVRMIGSSRMMEVAMTGSSRMGRPDDRNFNNEGSPKSQ